MKTNKQVVWMYSANWKGDFKDPAAGLRGNVLPRGAEKTTEWIRAGIGRAWLASGARAPAPGDLLFFYATPKWVGPAASGIFASATIVHCNLNESTVAPSINSLKFRVDKATSLRWSKEPLAGEAVAEVHRLAHSGSKPGWGQKASLWSFEGRFAMKLLFLLGVGARAPGLRPSLPEQPPPTSSDAILEDPDLASLSPEGAAVWKLNLVRERSAANRRRVLDAHPRPWACEACGFTFGDAFGPDHADYIQVHHRTPLGSGGRTQEIDDFNLLCANCHVVAHRQEPLSPLSVEQLHALRLAGRGPQPVVPEAPNSNVPVDTSGEGTALFVFNSPQTNGSSNLESVLRAVSELGDFPGQLGLLSGDLLMDVPPEASHLIMESSAPRWLVALVGDQATLNRALLAWERVAPKSALSGGFVALDPEEMGLAPRAALAKGELFTIRDDPDDGLFGVLGRQLIRLDGNLFGMAWTEGSDDRVAALKELRGV